MRAYEEILQSMLDRVPDDYDKREGSIVYTTLAPVALELVQQQFYFDDAVNACMVDTATGDDLTAVCAMLGTDREMATNALRRGTLALEGSGTVPVGTRFGADGITYTVVENLGGTSYSLQCQTPGTVGNVYSGALLPIDNVAGLQSANMETDIIIAARDDETDEELRARCYVDLRSAPYGGNVSDYETKTLAIDGVGAVQVFNAVVMGAGRVGLVIGDEQGNTASAELVGNVQQIMGVDGGGIAPIGHTVSVKTSTDRPIDVSAQIRIKTGTSGDLILPVVKQTIRDYIDGVAFTDPIVFYAKLVAAILSCDPSIEDIGNVTMAGSTRNLQLSKTYDNYEVPVPGEIGVSVIA